MKGNRRLWVAFGLLILAIIGMLTHATIKVGFGFAVFVGGFATLYAVVLMYGTKRFRNPRRARRAQKGEEHA